MKILGTKTTPHYKVIDIANLKAVKSDKGVLTITGYANTKNHADRYGDIPFGDSVYNLTAFSENPVMLLDHYNSVKSIAGSFKELEEDSLGLRFVAEFSNSDLPEIKHARTVYSEGHARALSIAGIFKFNDDKNPNHLTEADIFEISLVAVPADEKALVDEVKNLETNKVDLGEIIREATSKIKEA